MSGANFRLANERRKIHPNSQISGTIVVQFHEKHRDFQIRGALADCQKYNNHLRHHPLYEIARGRLPRNPVTVQPTYHAPAKEPNEQAGSDGNAELDRIRVHQLLRGCLG